MKKFSMSILFSMFFVTLAFPQVKQTTKLPPSKTKNAIQLPELSDFKRYIKNHGIITNFTGFDSTLAYQFQHVLDSMLISNNITGASVAISMPEKGTWLGVSGLSNPATGDSIRPDMLFDIGSNTKTFIAALMLKLVDDGLLTLEDQLYQWLPGFPNIDSTVTIRQLLNHTSGISDFLNENPAAVDTLFSYPDRYWSPEYSLTYVLEPNFSKGTSWSYSNTGYILAGMIIKEATASDKVAPVLRNQILNPLNLNSTFLDIEDTLIGEIPHSWMYLSETHEWVDFLEIPRTSIYSSLWTAGAMVSTAEDMVKWIRLLYSGQVLSQASLEEMFSVVPFDNPTFLGYGLGTMKQLWLGELAWAHGGDTFSYGSQAIYFPGRDVAIVVMVNQRNYPYQDIYNIIIEQLFKKIQNYYLYPHDITHLYNLEISSIFIQTNEDTLKITSQLNNPNNHNVEVAAKIISTDSAYIDSTILYDDGNHFDGNANDGLFGGFLDPLSIENEFFVSARSLDFDTGDYRVSNDIARFTTNGPVVIDSFAITTGDTMINPGDIIPLRLTLKNNGKNTTVKNIKTKISCIDSLQLTISGEPTYSDIAPGQTSVSNGIHVVILPENFASNNDLTLKVDIFSGNNPYWTEILNFYIYPTGIEPNNTNGIPVEFALHQNYPNPFNAQTVVEYQLSRPGHIRLEIYNLLGQKIRTLINESQRAGHFRVVWDGKDKFGKILPSGVYFYRLETENFSEIKKMLFLQ